jgi:hypothetical protein
MDELLIPIVIFAVTILSGWLQKRAQRKQEAEEQAAGEQLETPSRSPAAPPVAGSPSSTPSSRPPVVVDWERELRRMLEGDTSEPEPPPVVTQPQPQPAPPVVHRPAPPPLPDARTPEPAARASSSPSPLHHSDEAYRRAQQIQHSTADHLRKTVERTRAHAAARIETRPASKAREAAIRLVQRPEAVRNAVVVALILGPPKALEPSESTAGG